MFKETIFALYSLLNGGGLAPAPEPAPVIKAVRIAQAERLPADQVVQRIQKFYEKTDRLTAKFRQSYTNKTFGKTTTSNGRVRIKKPGKMRWDYYEKAGSNKRVQNKSFISDGTTLWAVEHDNKQAFKKNLEEDLLPVAVTFLYGKGDLSRDFDAKLVAGKKWGSKAGEYVLELTPKQPSAQYKTLWLVVSPKDFRVRRSIVLEASENTNAFTFYEPDLEKDVKDSWFTVNERELKKKKYRIVEPDETK